MSELRECPCCSMSEGQWHEGLRSGDIRCNNETEAALCATSESWCSPSESGSTERCSSCFGRTRRRCFKVGGEKIYIMTNYVAIYLVPRVLHACYSVRDVSDAESRGLSGPRSEVRSPKSGGLQYRFQHSRNRYVTP